MLTRRDFLKSAASTSAGVMIAPDLIMRIGYTGRTFLAAIPGGSIPDPAAIPKYVTPLLIPPAMPRAGKVKVKGAKNIDYYEIAVREFYQQILPAPFPATKVWGYGPVVAQNGPQIFNAPSLTIEAKYNKPVMVKWINELVDADGNYVQHLLPVDQTLHWANPPGGEDYRDRRGDDPSRYQGPVPMVTHVHGAHTTEDSDGYPEAWYLPKAANIPGGYATTGTFYDYYKTKYGHGWTPGLATFEYPNDQPATTLWYHDHTLGMTRTNVYAGPAGFYIIRGGPTDAVRDARTALPAILPGPAPALGDAPGTVYHEIPIVIQDRSFNSDGSLFYPDNRAFFEGLDPADLEIPFTPDEACDGEPSDVAPIWNPEFFGNTMMINGNTWPFLEVEQRRYRFRLLNGCNSRFLILDFNEIGGVEVWQIGGDQSFLPGPVDVTGTRGNRLLLAPAERMDVIVDFTNVATGRHILRNTGPDEPFGGGEPDADFDAADSDTTGQVMAFDVVAATGVDTTTPPQFLQFPAIPPLVPSTPTRPLSLNEEESKTVRVLLGDDGTVSLACDDSAAEPFGPTAALLGTLTPKEGEAGLGRLWMDAITETPELGAVEEWEFHNYTADAHPIHIHQVHFQVVGREPFGGGTSAAGSNAPLPEEQGYKDTVITYPGEVTRVRALFDLPGFYVWHCHIVEHEDNEMMRPFHVGPIPADAPGQ